MRKDVRQLRPGSLEARIATASHKIGEDTPSINVIVLSSVITNTFCKNTIGILVKEPWLCKEDGDNLRYHFGRKTSTYISLWLKLKYWNWRVSPELCTSNHRIIGFHIEGKFDLKRKEQNKTDWVSY